MLCSFVLLLTIPLSSLVSAASISPCKPNFLGSAVQVVNCASGQAWSVPSDFNVGCPVSAGNSDAAAFLISFDGSAADNYTIK